MYKFWIN